MAEQRLIIVMAHGVDLYGRDDTKAARRAVEQALQGAALPIFGTLGLDRDVMRVVVHVAVPRPEAVDVDALGEALRHCGLHYFHFSETSIDAEDCFLEFRGGFLLGRIPCGVGPR